MIPGTIPAEFEFRSKFCRNCLINLAGLSAKIDYPGIPGISRIPPDSGRNQWRTIKTSDMACQHLRSKFCIKGHAEVRFKNNIALLYQTQRRLTHLRLKKKSNTYKMKSILTAMLLLLAPLALLAVSAREEGLSECSRCTTEMVNCHEGVASERLLPNGQPCWQCCICMKCPLFFCFFGCVC